MPNGQQQEESNILGSLWKSLTTSPRQKAAAAKARQTTAMESLKMTGDFLERAAKSGNIQALEENKQLFVNKFGQENYDAAVSEAQSSKIFRDLVMGITQGVGGAPIQQDVPPPQGIPGTGTSALDYGATQPVQSQVDLPAPQPTTVDAPPKVRPAKISYDLDGGMKVDLEIDSGATALFDSYYKSKNQELLATGMAPQKAHRDATKDAYMAASLFGDVRINADTFLKMGPSDAQAQAAVTSEIGKALKEGYTLPAAKQRLESLGYYRTPEQWREATQFAYDMSIVSEMSDYLNRAQAAERGELPDEDRNTVFSEAENAYNDAKARVDERFGQLPTGTAMYDDQSTGVRQQLDRLGYGPGQAIPRGELITAQGLAEKHALGLSARQKAQQQQAIMAQKLRSAELSIEHLSNLSKKVHTADPGLVNRLWQGGKLMIGILSEENIDAAKYDKEKMGFMRFIARAFGEVGVLTKQDIQEMARMFPSILTTRGLAEGLFKDISKLMAEIAGRKERPTGDVFDSQEEALSYINELGEDYFTNNAQFQEDVRLLLDAGPPETDAGEIGAIINSTLFQGE